MSRLLCLVLLLLSAAFALAQPVSRVLPWSLEARHPFPHLLRHWWRVVPHLRAGSTWFPAPASLQYPCTLTATTWEPATRPGSAGALGFNGSTSLGDCGQQTWLYSAPALTVTGWAYQTTLSVNAGLWHVGSATSFYVAFYTYNDSQLYFDIGGANYGGVAYTSVVAARTWFHWAAVYNGAGATNANRLQLYLNGSAQTVTFGGTLPATLPNNSPAPFEIGRHRNADLAIDDRWNGALDDIQVYPVALTAAQIQTLYQASRAGYEPLVPEEVTPGGVPVARVRKRVHHQ